MERNIGYEIKTLDNLIERRLRCEAKHKNKRLLTPIHVKIILYIIKNNNLIHQADLEREFKFRRSTVLGILKTMEKNDLIKRINSKENAKFKDITLTEKSLKRANHIKKETQKFEELLVRNIDKEELEIFLKVIEKIKFNTINN